MNWIVFDYAGVIGRLPPEAAGDAPAAILGVAPERMWPAYWEHRLAYDLGTLDATAYWRAVADDLGVAVDAARVDLLADHDAEIWNVPNHATLDVLTELADAGSALALLSNAPAPLARAFEQQPWAALFRHHLFSADLRLAKPDPRIFAATCARLDARPDELFFVDDRPENVAAAREFGINAVLFTDAARLRADLAGIPSPTADR